MSKRPRPRLLDSLALTMTAHDKKRANGTNSSTKDRTGNGTEDRTGDRTEDCTRHGISNHRSLTNHPIKHRHRPLTRTRR